MPIRATLYKSVRKYHLFVGVFIALHLIILSLSGLILLFKAEIQLAEVTNFTTNPSEFIEKYNQAHQFLLRNYPNYHPLDMYPTDANPHIIQTRMGLLGVNKVSGAKVINIDYETVKQLQPQALRYEKFYGWLLSLHHQLFLGERGQIYIGVIGIAFIFMNISGLILFTKRRSSKPTSKSRLSKFITLHQYLGTSCLCWGILVGLSGALLALNPIFTKKFQQNTLQTLATKYEANLTTSKQPEVALEAILKTVFTVKPNGVIWYIVFPGMERGIKDHYLVLVHGNGIFNQYLSEYFIINSKTAELKAIVKLPILMQMTFAATPLHTVNFGSLSLKIIWSVFALSTCSFAILGLLIFLNRNGKRYAQRS